MHTKKDSSFVALMIERERDGRCGECGVQTHEFVVAESISASDLLHAPSKSVKQPITIEGEVHRGRCLFCYPFPSRLSASISNDVLSSRPQFADDDGNASADTIREKVTEFTASANGSLNSFQNISTNITTLNDNLDTPKNDSTVSDESDSNNPVQQDDSDSCDNRINFGNNKNGEQSILKGNARNILVGNEKTQKKQNHQMNASHAKNSLSDLAKPDQVAAQIAMQQISTRETSSRKRGRPRKYSFSSKAPKKGTDDFSQKIIKQKQDFSDVSPNKDDFFEPFKPQLNKNQLDSQNLDTDAALLLQKEPSESNNFRNESISSTKNNDNASYTEPVTIKDLIDDAIKKTKSFKTQERLCVLLRQKAERAEHAEEIMKYNRINIVLKAMREHRAKSSVQVAACGLLANLAWISNEFCAKIGKAGAISEIVFCLKRHNSGHVFESAIEALRHLGTEKENQLEIINGDALKSVISCMNKKPRHKAVQERACGLLYDLANASPTQYGKQIEKYGAIPVVLNAMRNHSNEVLVQENACGVLLDLAHISTCRERIGKEDGIELIVQCMSNFNNVEIQTAGCMALLNLSYDSIANRNRIAEEGAIGSVITAMKNFPDDKKLQTSALGLLQNLAYKSAHASEIVRQKGAETIIALMKHHSSDYEIQKDGCSVLQNLDHICDKQSMKTAVVVTDAMSNHFRNAKVQVEGLAVLSKMSSARVVRDFLAQDTIKDLIRNVGETHSSVCGDIAQKILS